MASFFDNDDDEDFLPPNHHPQNHASTSRLRESSIISATDSGSGAGSRSFLARLESTASPGPGRSFSSLPNDDFGSDLGKEKEEDEEEEEEALDDVRRMGRVWVRERGSVEIMRWEGDSVDSLFDKLEQQQKLVDTLQSDPRTSEEEHFKLVLLQMEVERVKFLVRSYVRTRLSKIEKYSYWIVETPSVHALLSGAELSHARRYTELLHTHFQHSVLDSLPEWLRKMNDSYGDGLSMVTKPNRNVPVLIYCRKDCGEITLEGGEGASLARGTTHLVKYNLVEQWIKLGWAEVL